MPCCNQQTNNEWEPSAVPAPQQPKFEPPSHDPLPLTGRRLDTNDRLTVQLIVHHEHVGDNPIPFRRAYDRWLESKDQPYNKRITVGPEWKNVSKGWQGWMDNPAGVVVLENKTMLNPGVNPSPEELKVLHSKVIDLAFGNSQGTDLGMADLELPVGDCQLLRVAKQGRTLWARCQAGNAEMLALAYNR